MNPGYLTFILMCISSILFASGWKDVLFRGVSHTSILLFFAGWFATGWWSVEIGPLHFRLTIFVLLAASCICTASIKDNMGRIHAWSAGLLIGSFDLFMREFKGWQIMMHSFGPYLSSTLILAAAVYLLGRQPVFQFVAVTVGLLASECTGSWLHRVEASGVMLGRAAFFDHWWLTMFAVRILTVIMEQSVRLTAVFFRLLHRDR